MKCTQHNTMICKVKNIFSREDKKMSILGVVYYQEKWNGDRKSDKYEDKYEPAVFFDMLAFGNNAEFVSKYVKEGMMVQIDYSIKKKVPAMENKPYSFIIDNIVIQAEPSTYTKESKSFEEATSSLEKEFTERMSEKKMSDMNNSDEKQTTYEDDIPF